MIIQITNMNLVWWNELKKKLKNKNNNLTLKKQKTSKDYRKTFKK